MSFLCLFYEVWLLSGLLDTLQVSHFLLNQIPFSRWPEVPFMSARIIILIERIKDFDQKFIHRKCFLRC